MATAGAGVATALLDWRTVPAGARRAGATAVALFLGAAVPRPAAAGPLAEAGAFGAVFGVAMLVAVPVAVVAVFALVRCARAR